MMVHSTAYAVTTEHSVVEAYHLPRLLSAQTTEIFALTKVYLIAKDVSATIFIEINTWYWHFMEAQRFPFKGNFNNAFSITLWEHLMPIYHHDHAYL